MSRYKRYENSQYIDHFCCFDKNFDGKVIIDSENNGKTFGFDEEYRHEILFCPYCGVQLTPDCLKWLGEQKNEK